MGMVAHAFYPNTLGAKTGGYHVLEARALE